LLDINNVRDKKEVDQEETNKDPIHLALRKGNRFVFHAYLKDIQVTKITVEA
jgi:hypothetical protein